MCECVHVCVCILYYRMATKSSGSLLSHLGNLVLLVVLVDVLWRAASNKFDSSSSRSGRSGSHGDGEEADSLFSVRSSVREAERQKNPMPFVEVYALSLAPLK